MTQSIHLCNKLKMAKMSLRPLCYYGVDILVSDHLEYGGPVGGHFVTKFSRGWSQCREDAI